MPSLTMLEMETIEARGELARVRSADIRIEFGDETITGIEFLALIVRLEAELRAFTARS